MYLVLTLKYVINESSLAFLLRKDGVEQQDQTSIITVQKLDDGGRLTLGYSIFFLIIFFSNTPSPRVTRIHVTRFSLAR